MNLELYEKPGSLGNSCLKPRPWLAPIPSRAGALTPIVPPDQWAGTFTTCGPCWRCTCDLREVCNQRSPRCRGPWYLSVLGLLFRLQNTCKWRAHQNQWKPTPCTSQWISYRQTNGVVEVTGRSLFMLWPSSLSWWEYAAPPVCNGLQTDQRSITKGDEEKYTKRVLKFCQGCNWI